MLRVLWFCAGAAGLLAVWAGIEWARATLIQLGAACLSVMALVLGVEAVVKRHYTTVRRDADLPYGGPYEFRGLSGLLMGAGFMLLGLAGLAGTWAFATGREQALCELLLRRPATVLLPVGTVLVSWGAARVLGAVQWRGSLWTVVQALPERYAGLLMLLSGLAAAAAGAFELVDPAGFDRRMISIFSAGAARPELTCGR